MAASSYAPLASVNTDNPATAMETPFRGVPAVFLTTPDKVAVEGALTCLDKRMVPKLLAPLISTPLKAAGG